MKSKYISADRDGSLITANLANDYICDVFSIPGRVTEKYSQSCNDLIKTQKANVLAIASDLVYVLIRDVETKAKPI